MSKNNGEIETTPIFFEIFQTSMKIVEIILRILNYFEINSLQIVLIKYLCIYKPSNDRPTGKN